MFLRHLLFLTQALHLLEEVKAPWDLKRWTHLCAAGSSMRLASCDSWLLLLVSTMLGRRCSSLREGGGGVWEALVEQDLGTRAVGGQLMSPDSSADESEQGTTEMEMERPWPPPPPCRGGPLVKLGKGTVGEKTSLSWLV